LFELLRKIKVILFDLHENKVDHDVWIRVIVYYNDVLICSTIKSVNA